MKTVSIKLKDIIPYDKNARKNDGAVDVVANSLAEFGWQQPLVLDKDNVIIAGHTRFKAAKKLGFKEAPCVIATDLTEEQVKAYRLADNKTAEAAEWDYDLLDIELEEILTIDMEQFGFEFIEEEQNKKDTQKRVESILNLEKASFEGVGKYDIPQLSPLYEKEIGEITEWIGFNYCLSDDNPEGKGVHFFIDDYQFLRLWNNPEKYMEMLSRYEAVMTPDFSPYADMPMATQIFNHYRKHWVGAMMQDYGIKVIPTIRASTDERSLEWYLDGEPEGGVVCISSMWTGEQGDKEFFLKEYEMMVNKLKPQKIYVYGNQVEEISGNIEYIDTFTRKRFGKG